MIKLFPALLMLAGVPAWCQPRGGFGRGEMMRTPAFQALDADHDGVISAAELASAATALKSLDKNTDGKLTEEEVRPQMRGGRGGRGSEPGETQGPSADEMVQTLMAFDKNGDGRLTRDELPERMQGLFDRADADKDGVLTAEEIRKSAQSASAPAGPRRGEGPEFMRLDPILAALDTNGDGEISASEIAAAATSLKTLDKNGDGQLSDDEVRPNFGGGRGRGRGPL